MFRGLVLTGIGLTGPSKTLYPQQIRCVGYNKDAKFVYLYQKQKIYTKKQQKKLHVQTIDAEHEDDRVSLQQGDVIRKLSYVI